jgi:hypothetical protein
VIRRPDAAVGRWRTRRGRYPRPIQCARNHHQAEDESTTSEYANGDDTPPVVGRRVGLAPSERADCTSSGNCPDVFELENGDYAIVGRDVSFVLELPADAGRSEAERIVLAPRTVMMAAARDLLTGL